MMKFSDLHDQIGKSNKIASENRNRYPIQEQATLIEIWEMVPCGCAHDCTCKKLGCEFHWRLKRGLTFPDVRNSYLRMFVDKYKHATINRALNGGLPENVTGRARGAARALTFLEKKWDIIYKEVLGHNKTLFCNGWATDFFRNQWNFKKDIYESKLFCVLLPDICVPYDTKSFSVIKNFINSRGSTYLDILASLRKKTIDILIADNKKISDLRKLDDPQIYVPFNANEINLKKENVNYGNFYLPKARPISRILDKLFYKP